MKAVELKYKTSVELKPKAPYNFDATVFKPAHYPDPLKFYETGKYWFAMRFEDRIYGIKMESLGTTDRPKIKITIFSKFNIAKEESEKVIDELDFRFEFGRDISEFFNKFKNDKIFSPFLKRWYGMHGSCTQSLYGLLMIGIFLQNTVVKRTVQMTEIILKKYGIKVNFDGKEVFEFLEPEKIKSWL